jgi:hypothetical protein
VVVILGVLFLVIYFRKMKKPAAISDQPITAEQPVEPDEYVSRFEEALKKRK